MSNQAASSDKSASPPTNTLASLAAAVRVIRAREGLTQAEVARRGGLSQNYPGQIERGRANPTHMQLDQLARGLGLRDVAELWQQAIVEAERAQ